MPVPQFRERYLKPSFELRLAGCSTDLIEEGIDKAVLRRARGRQDSRFTSRRLAPHRLCAFAVPAHGCVNFRYQSYE